MESVKGSHYEKNLPPLWSSQEFCWWGKLNEPFHGTISRLFPILLHSNLCQDILQISFPFISDRKYHGCIKQPKSVTKILRKIISCFVLEPTNLAYCRSNTDIRSIMDVWITLNKYSYRYIIYSFKFEQNWYFLDLLRHRSG